VAPVLAARLLLAAPLLAAPLPRLHRLRPHQRLPELVHPLELRWPPLPSLPPLLLAAPVQPVHPTRSCPR